MLLSRLVQMMSSVHKWSRTEFHRPVRRRTRMSGRPVPVTECLESRALLTLFVVNTLTDTLNDSLGVSNGQLSLREAIQASNTNGVFGDAAAGSPDGDTIVFADSLMGGTVQLQQGEFLLSDDIQVIGSTTGAGLSPGLSLSAGDLSRVFRINALAAAGSRSDVAISNLILSDGNASVAAGENGGAVLIGASENVTLTNLTVRDSVAAGNGGGISIGAGTSVIINGVSLLNNAAGTEGGGLWNGNGRLTILDGANDVTIDGNTAAGAAANEGGGGIYNSNGALEILDISEHIVTLSNNRATGTSGSGGAIFSGGGRLTIEETTIRTNSANRAGGGIEIVNGLVRLSNVNLVGNDVNGTAGTPMPGNGGGLHVSGIANVTIDSGSVFGNSAATEGGGLWNQAGSRLIIQNGTLIQANEAFGNAADEGGGGIYNNGGDVVVSTSQIVGNVARGTLGSGGGIFSNGGYITIQSTSLTGNEAERAGGAIEVAASTAATRLQIMDSTIANNSALGTGTAPGNGGGIHLSGSTTARIVSSQISGNLAAAEGGGLWNGTGIVTITGATMIDSNTAQGSASDEGGGGIYNVAGRIQINNINGDIVTLSNNRATGTSGSGGAIFSGGGRLTIEETTIRTNSANRAGGGIEIVNGLVRLSNVNLVGNDVNGTAGTPMPGNGGGLHVSGIANVTIDSGSVFGNSAATEGGGLWNQAGSRLIIQNGTLIQANEAFGNAADEGGGGIYNNGGDVVVSTSQIVGNVARGTLGSGGGIFSNGGYITIQSTSLTGNEAERAGGAIEVAASTAATRLRITDSTVATNSALGSGTAPGNGGGIHLAGAVTTMLTNSTVSGNYAAQDGGGIWSQLAGAERLIVTNSTITQNNAQRSGGGIWTEAPAGSAAVLSNSIVAQNTAGISAPDIRRFGTLFVYHNLIGNGIFSGLTSDADGDANGNLIGRITAVIDAKLGTLNDNGGPTETHLVLAGSPAINRGDNFRAINIEGVPLVTDQRGLGFPRIHLGIVDIGAVES